MGSATGEHFVALNRPISTEYFRGGCTIDWARSGDLALHPWGCVLASAAVQQVDAGGHARRLVLAVLGDGGEHAQAHLGMRRDREDGVGRQRSGLTPDEATLGGADVSSRSILQPGANVDDRVSGPFAAARSRNSALV